MASIFFITMGIAVAINYLVAVLAKDAALKLTSFILVTDFGASLAIQLLVVPPDRLVWRMLTDTAIITGLVLYRHVYDERKNLGTAMILGYLVMMIGNLATILTRGSSLATFEIVADVVFSALIIMSFTGGVRDAMAELGNGRHYRDSAIRDRHSHTGSR